MRGTWLGIGCAVVVGGCGSSDKPKPRAEDVATAVPPARRDAAAVAPVRDAAPIGEPLDSFPGFRFVTRGDVADAELVAKVTGGVEPLAKDCEDSDATQIYVAQVNLDEARPGAETVVASLPHGVYVLGGDAVIARTAEPLAPCEGSQTELIGLWAGQVVPDAEPELVVIDQFGGRNLGRTTLTIFKRLGERLEPIFTAALAEYEGDVETTRKVELAADGTITAETGDGKVAHRFDATATRFIAVGPP